MKHSYDITLSSPIESAGERELDEVLLQLRNILSQLIEDVCKKTISRDKIEVFVPEYLYDFLGRTGSKYQSIDGINFNQSRVLLHKDQDLATICHDGVKTSFLFKDVYKIIEQIERNIRGAN